MGESDDEFANWAVHRLIPCDEARRLVAVAKYWSRGAGGAAPYAMLWNLENNEDILKVGPESFDLCVNASLDLLAIGALEGVELRRLSTGRILRHFKDADRWIDKVLISQSGKLLVGVVYLPEPKNTQVWIWEIDTGKVVHVSQASHARIAGTMFSKKEDLLIAIDWSNTYYVWEMPNGKLVERFPGKSDLKPHVTATAHAPDRSWVAASGLDSPQSRAFLTVRQSPSGTKLLGVDKLPMRIFSLAPSPGGNLLALACGEDHLKDDSFGTGYLWIYDTETWGIHARLEPLPDMIETLAFSPDGRWLLLGAWDGKIRIVDVGRLQVVETVDAHEDIVSALAFSKDGERLWSGGYDGMIAEWSFSSTR